MKYTYSWLLAIILMFLSFSASAQSYSETFQFLQEKLNVSNNLKSQEVGSPSECEMVVTIQDSGFNGLGDNWVHQYSFELRHIDPSKTDYADYLTVRTIRGDKLIRVNTTYTARTTSRYREMSTTQGNGIISCNAGNRTCFMEQELGYAPFDLVLSPSNDNWPRVQRGLNHLVSLCDGEGELF